MNNTTRAKQRTHALRTALALLFSVLSAANASTNGRQSASATDSQHHVMSKLTERQQAIPLIGAAMASSDLPRLNDVLNQGLDAGLTVNEAKEILVQLYAYAGFPRSLNALGELQKVVEQRKARGVVDAVGTQPTEPAPTGKQLLAVGTANQTKISGAPVRGPVFEFAPVINTFLQTHLFGDIFTRDNLDWQSRELATVGALAATPGAEPQLRSHIAASIRVGLTVAQMRHLTELLSDKAEPKVAERALLAFDSYLATQEGN